MSVNDYIKIAKITKTHGVRGEVKLFLYTKNIQQYKNFFISENKVEVAFRGFKADNAIAKIEGVSDVDQAKSLQNEFLLIQKIDLPKTNDKSFYYADLVGAKILTTRNKNQSSRWNENYHKYFLFRVILKILNKFNNINYMSILSSGRIAPLLPLKSNDNKLWVEAMASLINWYKNKSNYFRWHDSGDLQGVAHLKKIVEVCNKTPGVSHWLPTREAGFVKEYKNKFGDFPKNLVVRISATMVNGVPHKSHGHSSTVVTSEDLATSHLCQAYKQGNE